MLAAGKGLAVDVLAKFPELANTRLERTFRANPLGVLDIGSLGGVHPFLEPAASLIQVLCFEPHAESFAALQQQYASSHPYADVRILQDALGGTNAKGRPLYIPQAVTNTSLLEPSRTFISRYQAKQFELARTIKVDTRPLDDIIFSAELAGKPYGEVIKIDTQGSEHEVFLGAARVLRERCVAVVCEVEFFEVYRGQKTFADIDILLREYGFALYGLYPHYRSTKSVDPSRRRTEERIMWADAVFFKDPFDDGNATRPMNERQVDALILAAWLTCFYDFAIELSRRFVSEAEGSERLVAIAQSAAEAGAAAMLEGFRAWARAAGPSPTYIDVRRLIDRNYSNSSADFFMS